MAVSPSSSSSLELTISIPGFSSSPSNGDQDHQNHEGGYGIKDLDINQPPSGGGRDDNQEWISTEDDDQESTINGEGGGPPRKKLRLSKDQSRLLEESFRLHHTLNPRQKEALALQLKLRPRQVEVWFQNRRARSKLKQTEMECEYLKRWFGSLTEQNRRLHREVEELRAMKVGPPTVLSPHSSQPLLASTLSMCPRCERVTSTAAATTTTVVAEADKTSTTVAANALSRGESTSSNGARQ